MLDLGWSELVIVAVLALVVVGPKDLPGLLRTVGRWVGKARAIAGEFSRLIEDAATEAEVADIRKKVQQEVTEGTQAIKDAVAEPEAKPQPEKKPDE